MYYSNRCAKSRVGLLLRVEVVNDLIQRLSIFNLALCALTNVSARINDVNDVCHVNLLKMKIVKAFLDFSIDESTIGVPKHARHENDVALECKCTSSRQELVLELCRSAQANDDGRAIAPVVNFHYI